jgi:hypothetical protein
MNLHISLHKMEGAFGHAGSAQNGASHSSSHGVFNETMPLVPVQSGAVIGGVAGPATNLNIGMDYWGATGSSPVPAMRSKVASGSARGEQWVCTCLPYFQNKHWTKILSLKIDMPCFVTTMFLCRRESGN